MAYSGEGGRGYTPAPSTSCADAAGFLFLARAFDFGLLLFMHLLMPANQTNFRFTPGLQLWLNQVGGGGGWAVRPRHRRRAPVPLVVYLRRPRSLLDCFHLFCIFYLMPANQFNFSFTPDMQL